jgi:hypothetical protein
MRAKFWPAIRKVRKAIAAALTIPVMVGLKKLGLDLGPDVVELLIATAITSLVVWAIPNAQAELDKED